MLPYMSPRPRDRARVSCVSCTEGRFFSSEPLGKPLICVYSHKLSFDAMESEKNQRASRSVLSDSLRTHGLWPAKLLCPWNSPSKHTGVGCHFLLQGIFPTQGSNLGLLDCRQFLHCLSHQKESFFSILREFGIQLSRSRNIGGLCFLGINSYRMREGGKTF